MQPKKPVLVLVDDEPEILEGLTQLLDNECEVYAFTSAAEALPFVEQQPPAVVISDQRMPGMLGHEFLQLVSERSPNSYRILLTGYSDLQAVMSAVNTGAVQQYLKKPWNAPSMRALVRDAVTAARRNATGVSVDAETLRLLLDTLDQKDKSPMVVYEATKTLMKLRPKSALPRLKEILSATGDFLQKQNIQKIIDSIETPVS